ncbi:helix-turn-helix domain-containing protein [Litchfieldia sinesaloumensis]|uniref:helix-turn-helix domain-containing protein n=1 Tax=Litchfieldia sinesaloumensis TaxID=1926280 RepID=UPI000988512A|nr:helix-turn-helix domain-containing protein [Bacillus sinesaloumensis]
MSAHMKKYRQLCKLLSDIHDVSIFFVTTSGDIAFECIDGRILNPLYLNDKENLFSLLDLEPNTQYHIPIIKRTYFFENYILISVLHDDTFIGTVIIGPTLPYVLFEQKIHGIINDFHSFANREQVFNYYQTVPVITKEKLLDISVASYYMINQILLSTEAVAYQNTILNHMPEKMEPTNLVTTRMDQWNTTHHDPLLEKQLLMIIKEGRVEELKKFTKLEEEVTGVLSKSSHIRSKKNIGIIGISIATRAAIDGGLHPEIAFSLSDNYIQRLEDLSTAKDIDNLLTEALFTFTKKVSEVKEENYSKTISTCKNYIYTNRYEKVTHEDIAIKVQLSQSYLSSLFKKEVGISVSDYISKIKIEEAKNLIMYTDTPLSEISSLLHFTDQSYFTKVFKKFEGITPKQYKERNIKAP